MNSLYAGEGQERLNHQLAAGFSIDTEIGTFEVKSTSGDGHLGGDDYDEELINHLAEGFRKQEGVDKYIKGA